MVVGAVELVCAVAMSVIGEDEILVNVRRRRRRR